MLDGSVSPPDGGRILCGRYRVLRPLAEGGIGRVYEAEQLSLGRRVAIKMLLPHYARNPELLQRFRREAEIVSHLAHPHIVQVFDIDQTEDGEPFLVMELLEGETVADYLMREQRARLPIAIKIASQVASALAATHAHGVVHRDLKPENVFLQRALGESEFVKVLDFGVCMSQARLRHRLTGEHEVVGTPGYMAPEQATASSRMDARVDQFALSAMVYEMLAGRPPFVGDDPAEVMRQIVNSDPPRLQALAPWVAETVDAVIHRGLRREPRDRYASISEFAQALTEADAAAGVAVTLPPDHQRDGRYSVSAPREELAAPPSKSRPPRVEPAASVRDELARARSAMFAGRLDEAVAHAERLFEIAVYGHDKPVYELLAEALPFCERIFAHRVGNPSRQLVVTSRGMKPDKLNLSPKAAALLARASQGATVEEVLNSAQMPTRDSLRILAGLMRRGALSTI
jgi:serine/threonine protein kinase